MPTKQFLQDPDLDFLAKCSNEDLKVFADLLVYGEDDKPRMSEALSKDRVYKENYPNNLQAAWKEIAHEFQLFGGNTFANLIRGYGVPYREILMDVCDKKNVNYKKTSSTERIEMYLIQKLMDDALDYMSDEQLQEVLADLKMDATQYATKEAAKDAIVMACMSPALLGRITAILAATLTLNPKLAIDAVVFGVRMMNLLVPALNVVLGLWLLTDIPGGPAYHVTIPGVVLIIHMRNKLRATNL